MPFFIANDYISTHNRGRALLQSVMKKGCYIRQEDRNRLQTHKQGGCAKKKKDNKKNNLKCKGTSIVNEPLKPGVVLFLSF